MNDIKKLDWVKKGEDFYANTPVGQYGVGKIGPDYSAILRFIADDQDDDLVLVRNTTRELAHSVCQADFEARVSSCLSINPTSATDLGEVTGENGELDAGINYAIERLCEILDVDPKSISWDAATETLDGDVMSVICNVLIAAYGDDWSSKPEDIARIRAALSSVPTAEKGQALARPIAWRFRQRGMTLWQHMEDRPPIGLDGMPDAEYEVEPLYASPAQPVQEMHELEPVAYLNKRGDEERVVLAKFVDGAERMFGSNGWTAIPLYTSESLSMERNKALEEAAALLKRARQWVELGPELPGVSMEDEQGARDLLAEIDASLKGDQQ